MSRWLLRPLDAADLPRVEDLFEAYPYKQTQAAVQRLDRARLIAFYRRGLERAVASGTPHWIAERDGQPMALAGLVGDPWHTQVYGFAMAKLQPWLCLDPEVGPDLLAAVEAAARARGIAHLTVRLDGADYGNLHAFERAGWLTTDVSLKFSMPLPPAVAPPAPARVGLWRIEPATSADAPWIRALGSQTHAASHFFNDPALPADATRELFARWIDRCLDGLAYRIDTLRDDAGQGRGFVIYLTNDSFARAVGRRPLVLDFVLIDPALRGAGVGPWFIVETLRRQDANGFDYCELRTSAHNLPAVIGYEKIGFRCCASDFTLSKRLPTR